MSAKRQSRMRFSLHRSLPQQESSSQCLPSQQELPGERAHQESTAVMPSVLPHVHTSVLQWEPQPNPLYALFFSPEMPHHCPFLWEDWRELNGWRVSAEKRVYDGMQAFLVQEHFREEA